MPRRARTYVSYYLVPSTHHLRGFWERTRDIFTNTNRSSPSACIYEQTTSMELYSLWYTETFTIKRMDIRLCLSAWAQSVPTKPWRILHLMCSCAVATWYCFILIHLQAYEYGQDTWNAYSDDIQRDRKHVHSQMYVCIYMAYMAWTYLDPVEDLLPTQRAALRMIVVWWAHSQQTWCIHCMHASPGHCMCAC